MPPEGRGLHKIVLSEDTSAVLRNGGTGGNKTGKNNSIFVFQLKNYFHSWFCYGHYCIGAEWHNWKLIILKGN